MRDNRGFTLIELVLVITILGILAVSALPNFINVATQARQSSRDGVVGAVRAGVALSRANNLVTAGPPGVYPATLDAAAAGACAAANRCFDTVVTGGIADGAWSKTNGTTYVFNDGTTTFTYTYSVANGTFTAPNAP
ncbi:MAG: type II secretion system protein [Deltaproteobacteria bacterium]|nr:type II secretion system protein [Deltaproteobacteria bacterium]